LKFKARVKSEQDGEWFDTGITVIMLDKFGQPEAVIGKTGLRYEEFELEMESAFGLYDAYKGEGK